MPPTSAKKAFVQSIAVEVLNPKTAIFFMAFLPQFVDGDGGLPLWAQLAVIGAMVNANFTFADVVCVLLAGFIMTKLKGSNAVQRLLQRAGGTLLVGLGLQVAMHLIT